MSSFGRELSNELKSFKVRFFNVKKPKDKKPADGKQPADQPGEKPAERPAEESAAELRAAEKAQKPMGGKFHRITPKFRKLT